MNVAPLIRCIGKLLRKGASTRLVTGMSLHPQAIGSERVHIYLARPARTEIGGRPLYRALTFPELRRAIAKTETTP